MGGCDHRPGWAPRGCACPNAHLVSSHPHLPDENTEARPGCRTCLQLAPPAVAEPRPVGLNPGSASALCVTAGTCTDLFGLSGLTNKMGIRVTGRIQMVHMGKNSQPQRRPSGNADPPSTPLETTDWFLRPQSHAHGLVTWPRCDCEVTRLTFLTHQSLSRPGALPLQSHAPGRLSLSPSQAARTRVLLETPS